MSWELLPTDYTDVSWSGYKKYTQISNSDGSVSFVDITEYTNQDNSFFGAYEANRMNEALNTIMSMLENGTDLYEAFTEYFEEQKELFEAAADETSSDFTDYLTALKESYTTEIETFEATQEEVFNTWFQVIKDQLSSDAAGELAVYYTELEERVSELETMIFENYFYASLIVEDDDSDETTYLVDESGNYLLADWKYQIA